MAGGASGIKWGDDGGGSLIRPDGAASIRMVGVSASVIFPCTIKSRRRFLLAPAHLGSPRKRAVKQLCVKLIQPVAGIKLHTSVNGIHHAAADAAHNHLI